MIPVLVRLVDGRLEVELPDGTKHTPPDAELADWFREALVRGVPEPEPDHPLHALAMEALEEKVGPRKARALGEVANFAVGLLRHVPPGASRFARSSRSRKTRR